jgi:hypothetical protein
MKNRFLAVAMTAVAGLSAMVPCAAAAPGDRTTFSMVRAAGATCLSNKARGRVTISDLGPVQNMHVEVSGLTPNNDFTLFVTQHSTRPFGLSWYQGEISTDKKGNGVGDFTGVFSPETFVLTPDGRVQTSHVAMWFADPNDAANAGCAGIPTPFDGDGVAGILVLSTENFPDDKGPLQRLGANGDAGGDE